MAVELRHPKGRVFFDGNAAAAALGSLEWYRAGTTTKQTVYADKDESVPLPNPLTLDSAGRAVDSGGDLVAVYFSDSSGNDAKEVLKDSNGATVYTDDEIPQPVDPTEGLSDFAKPLTQWSTDTASSVDIGTSDLGRCRLADTSSNSITYNLPSASAAGNGKGIVIKKTAAANSVTLDGDGSETIDGSATFSWTEDGRVYVVVSDGANWRIAWTYFPPVSASKTVAGTQENADQSEMEAASSDDRSVTPDIFHHHPGAAKVWAYVSEPTSGNYTLEESYNVTSITDNGQGDVTVTIDTDFSSANYSAVGAPTTSALRTLAIKSKTAGSFDVNIWGSTDDDFNTDEPFSVAAFGDQ